MFDSLKKVFRGVVTTNVDGLSREEQEETIQEILNSSDIPVHKGKTEHGYSLSMVANPAKCPRCSAATEVRYAEFIYATQKGTRIMAAPAGFFCTRCPTVVIDEDLLRQGVSKGFVYQSVIGTENGGPFRTWNGREAILFIDEVEKTVGLIPKDQLAYAPDSPTLPSKDKFRKTARRRELAKASRKRNRRK